MAINNAINNISFTKVRHINFFSSGIYTPTPNLKALFLQMQAGGGASGGIQASSGASSVSGAGGGGGYLEVWFYTDIQISRLFPSVTITIGLGGTGGGTGNTSGNPGGDTTFAQPAPTSPLIVYGGQGGSGSTDVTSPQTTAPGDGGGANTVSNANVMIVNGTSGGWGQSNGTSSFSVYRGQGGMSYLGRTVSPGLDFGTNTKYVTGFGAGASGSYSEPNNTQSYNGVSGTQGCVMIVEYY